MNTEKGTTISRPNVSEGPDFQAYSELRESPESLLNLVAKLVNSWSNSEKVFLIGVVSLTMVGREFLNQSVNLGVIGAVTGSVIALLLIAGLTLYVISVDRRNNAAVEENKSNRSAQPGTPRQRSRKARKASG